MEILDTWLTIRDMVLTRSLTIPSTLPQEMSTRANSLCKAFMTSLLSPRTNTQTWLLLVSSLITMTNLASWLSTLPQTPNSRQVLPSLSSLTVCPSCTTALRLNSTVEMTQTIVRLCGNQACQPTLISTNTLLSLTRSEAITRYGNMIMLRDGLMMISMLGAEVT